MTNLTAMTLTRDDPVHGKTFSHQAFGQISVSRVSSTPGTVLYGSDFLHGVFVRLTVSRSELQRSLSRDWHHDRNELISVDLSEAQWATFVSSFNVGGGVPCTLNRVAGESMPSIPLRQEPEIVRKETLARSQEMLAEIRETIRVCEKELDGLSKKRRDTVMAKLRHLEMEMEHNEPFRLRSLDKHMENTVEKAKIEVNAYVEGAVMRAGLDAIEAKKLLTSGEQ